MESLNKYQARAFRDLLLGSKQKWLGHLAPGNCSWKPPPRSILTSFANFRGAPGQRCCDANRSARMASIVQDKNVSRNRCVQIANLTAIREYRRDQAKQTGTGSTRLSFSLFRQRCVVPVPLCGANRRLRREPSGVICVVAVASSRHTYRLPGYRPYPVLERLCLAT